MSSYTAEIGVKAVLPEAAASAPPAADLRDVERFKAAMTDDDARGVAGEEREPPEGSAFAAAPVSGAQAPRWVPVPLAGASAQAGPRSSRPVSAAPRARLQTHSARSRAMQPLLELLVGVHERAGGRAVREMKIVPPKPNPLQLTLHLSMRDGEFVVAAHTGLGPEQREEVHQALHVLQTALAARLKLPARVVLLA
jgi:hypothetical protein